MQFDVVKGPKGWQAENVTVLRKYHGGICRRAASGLPVLFLTRPWKSTGLRRHLVISNVNGTGIPADVAKLGRITLYVSQLAEIA